MKPTKLLVCLGLLGLSLPASAAAVLVDFSNSDVTANSGSDTYNTMDNPTEGTAATWMAVGGSVSLNDLDDAAGNGTLTDISITTYNNGAGQLRGNGGAGGQAHAAVAGVEALAYGDAFWINNHNSNGTGAGNEFGFIISFSDLTEASYNISLLAGSSNLDGSWSITTGSGDSDVVPFSGQDDVLSWTNVAPVGGEIVLTGVSVPTNTNFQNTGINSISIEAVPEPSSAALLGLGGLALILRRRK